MATKQRELENRSSAINKAAPDEPVFVLRAQDKLASGLVRIWAGLAALDGTPPERVREALELAALMDAWHTHKHPD